MVYKPKKTVNGHKRNDRYSRRRKAAAARKRRLSNRPVQSNVKRYVAEQFGKTHPDNRYYLTIPQVLKPTNKLSDTPRYYPFGAHFQNAFLDIEFKRMKEVINQLGAMVPREGGHALNYPHDGKIGNYNHWRSVIGRGIHMKNSSVYGEIRLNEKIPIRFQNILKYGNLKLHMFCLEDKAVTKTEFLNWYKNFLATSGLASGVKESEQERSVTHSFPVDNGTFDTDIVNVPYVAGSNYIDDSSAVTTGAFHPVTERPSGGFEEFLVDWRKFYQTNENTNGVTDNPEASLFHNEVKCTTDWDGSRDKALLPVNKSRFIVHEHKTWSFKPQANGCLDTVIPFDYSFPAHYMTYDKELLDMPFVWNTDASPVDDQGLDKSNIFPRKQPFIVFVYTCDNPYMLDAPTGAEDIPNHPGGHVDFGGNDNLLRGPHNNNVEELNITPMHADNDAEQTAGGLGSRVWTTGTEPKEYPRHGEPPGSTQRAIYTRAYISTAESDTLGANELFDIKLQFKCSYENKLATSVVPTIHKGRPLIHKREPVPVKTRSREPRKINPFKKRSRERADLPQWMKGPKPPYQSVRRDFRPKRDVGPAASYIGAPDLSSADREIGNAVMDLVKDHPLESLITGAGFAFGAPLMNAARRMGSYLGSRFIFGATAARSAERMQLLGDTANAARLRRVAKTHIGPSSDVGQWLGRLRPGTRRNYLAMSRGIEMHYP